MVSPDYLTTLRNFYQIPSGVVFRIRSGNESAKDPPEGFFTCYEAFLVYCLNRILPPTPADFFAKRDLLRSRPFFWNSFTVERIRSAVELHRSRAVSQPLDVLYDVEPVIYVLPAQRQRIRSRKGKGVASARVAAELAGRSVSAVRFLGF
ncbi:hypothetical protein F2Q69_00013730 [Brassica cretica]|uniref:Uncharacterized protein n=1 Tax=Brassica cretica TaxID=69181 RepID=A0A8S9R183_BRACR|nr:hypothetical protein F2Q69_00013730 [Brassica cretica]